MSDRMDWGRDESFEEELDPHRRAERREVASELAQRLQSRGAMLTGAESSEELVSLLDAVERFERAVEVRGGDLMVDESPRGETREPDDVHFVLPRREPRESVLAYIQRIEDATAAVRRHRAL